jgi:hypothetical protein
VGIKLYREGFGVVATGEGTVGVENGRRNVVVANAATEDCVSGYYWAEGFGVFVYPPGRDTPEYTGNLSSNRNEIKCPNGSAGSDE